MFNLYIALSLTGMKMSWEGEREGGGERERERERRILKKFPRSPVANTDDE